MATVTWNNDNSTGVWNDADNWDTDSVPGSSDDVVFDDTSTDNCTCDVAIDIASLTVASSYSGKLDLGDSGYSHAVSGDITLDGSGEFDMGDATLTCSGNVDFMDIGTLTRGTSELVQDGTSKWYKTRYNKDINKWTIAGTITLHSDTQLYADTWGVATINEGATLTLNDKLQVHGLVINGTLIYASGNGVGSSGAGVTINGTLNLSGGTLSLNNESNMTCGESSSVTIGHLTTGFNTKIGGGNEWTVGTADISVNYNDSRSATIAGDIRFTGNVTITADNAGNTFTVDNSGNHNLTFEGDVSCAEDGGTLVWTKGTGGITLSGGDDQDVDFLGLTVEDIEIDKDASADKVTLTGNVTTDSLTLTSGILEIDGNDLDVSGNFTMAAGTTVLDTDTNGSISIGGNLDINGTSGDGCTWTDADIDTLTGTGDADYCTVTDSNNSSGTTIDATDDCVDGSGNTGWDFGAPAADAMPMAVHHYKMAGGL